jgi:hypothetical protein
VFTLPIAADDPDDPDAPQIPDEPAPTPPAIERPGGV